MDVVYDLEPELTAAELLAVLQSSGLAERRPSDLARLDRMLRHADIVLTARIEGALVGISRAITDGAWCTYLSDLAVDRAQQGRGIGRRLIEETHRAAGLDTTLILIAAPGARTYYPHIGMEPHPDCWIIKRR